LEEEEHPELSMVELTYTRTNPKAMMIILSHTLSTVMTVLSPIWRFHRTELAEFLFRELHLGNVLNRFHFVVMNMNLFVPFI